MKKLLLFCLVLTAQAINGTACYGQALQPFQFQSYTTIDGLPASEATHLSEDENGFLWIATYGGICRFDGFKFKNYLLPIVDSSQVSGSNLIIKVLCWQKQVWCLNLTGQFFILDPSKDIFVYSGFSISTKKGDKPQTGLIDFIIDDQRGCFWIMGKESIRKLDLASGKTEEVLHSKAEITGDIFLDLNGMLWLPTSAGEICFNPDTKSEITFFDAKKITAHCLKGSIIYCLGSFDTICFIDTRTMASNSLPTNANSFYGSQKPNCAQSIIFAPGISGDSLLWISTCGDGVCVINIANGRYLARFNTDNYEDKGILHDWVSTFLITRDSCLWMGTQKGILKIDPRQQCFFTTKIPALKKIESSRIRQVLNNPMGQDEKWVATGEGLFLVKGNKNTVSKKFLQRNEKTENSKLWARINAMEIDNAGNLWLGTNGGLAKIDRSHRVKKFSTGKAGNEGVLEFISVGNDAFWVRNNIGAGLFWPERGQYFPIVFPTVGDRKSIGVYNLNAGLDQSALFSTDTAVFRVKLSDFNPECRCFLYPEIILSSILLYDLIENDSAIWGIVLNGLAEFHKLKGTLRIFGEKEGLTNMRVRSILGANDGHFWMNSDNGLFVFNTKYLRFKKYGEEDGLADSFIPGILGQDGDAFYAGFDSRYSSFQPIGKLYKTNIKPLITDVYALNERLPVDFSGPSLPSITVHHAQNILRFEFTCPDFYQSEKINFHYQLKGFDLAPVHAGLNRSAVYTNLDGGKYHFSVWVTNADGFQYDQPAVVLLRVIPPFYSTWWFYALCLTSVGGLFYAIFRYREIQRLRQEQLRLRIARDLHDEVGSTLSSISILSASVLNGVQKDLDNARFGNIGEKARAALDSISDIVWSVNPENDSMEKALARMSAYASEMLENVGTELRFEVGTGVGTLTLPMEKRKDFYLIFKEAIHNCAKYARAGQVEVVVKMEGNHLILSIKDDGVGFNIQNAEPEMPNMTAPNSTLKTQNSKLSLGGNGLRNMQSRAAAMGADFKIESALGAGTIVLIKIPMK